MWNGVYSYEVKRSRPWGGDATSVVLRMPRHDSRWAPLREVFDLIYRCVGVRYLLSIERLKATLEKFLEDEHEIIAIQDLLNGPGHETLSVEEQTRLVARHRELTGR
ncbi:MAG TPA: hypothetical protein VMC43_00025 [Candidatus Paceibacterota bacterium]|nr:hypothetical protein [Candidatus Paceibacterota bacterium]